MSSTLRDELRQTRPFQSLEQEAHLNLMRTAAVLTDRFELMLKPAGITPQQFNVLRILRGAGPDGLCRNELRDRMLTRMPDMTPGCSKHSANCSRTAAVSRTFMIPGSLRIFCANVAAVIFGVMGTPRTRAIRSWRRARRTRQ